MRAREDIHSDIEYVTIANTVFKRILKYLCNNKPSYDESSGFFYHRGVEGRTVMLRVSPLIEDLMTFGNPLSPTLEYLVQGSAELRARGFSAAYGTFRKRPAIIMFNITDEHFHHISKNFYDDKEGFIHEFTHYMGNTRRKYGAPSKTVAYHKNGEFSVEEYMSSPEEFNSFFNEAFERIHHNTLMLDHGNNQKFWFKMYPDFPAFLASVLRQFDERFLKSITPQRMKRLKNRLYQYYTWVSDLWKEYKNPVSKVSEAEAYITAYHGTNNTFDRFNFKTALQKIIWFASDKEVIKNGTSGAQGNKHILTLKIKLTNPAGWAEYDRLTLDELEQRGYDGAILPEKDGSFVGFVFKPGQVKIVKRESISTIDDKVDN